VDFHSRSQELNLCGGRKVKKERDCRPDYRVVKNHMGFKGGSVVKRGLGVYNNGSLNSSVRERSRGIRTMMGIMHAEKKGERRTITGSESGKGE